MKIQSLCLTGKGTYMTCAAPRAGFSHTHGQMPKNELVKGPSENWKGLKFQTGSKRLGKMAIPALPQPVAEFIMQRTSCANGACIFFAALSGLGSQVDN